MSTGDAGNERYQLALARFAKGRDEGDAPSDASTEPEFRDGRDEP